MGGTVKLSTFHLRCRVRLADRGNSFPQNPQACRGWRLRGGWLLAYQVLFAGDGGGGGHAARLATGRITAATAGTALGTRGKGDTGELEKGEMAEGEGEWRGEAGA
jgi:hypothetical protein